MKIAPLLGALVVAGFAWRRRRELEPTAVAGAVLLVAGLLLYGSGLVHPPNLVDLIRNAGEALGPYTYVLVGAFAFLETGAFIGLVAPGELAILVGGVIAGQGQIEVIPLIALVWACAVVGDVTSFFLGRRLGREFMVKHGPKVAITEERLVQVEGFVDKHGGKAIFLGRFVGLVRSIAPFLVGSTGMTLRRFLPYDVLGAGLWGWPPSPWGPSPSSRWPSASNPATSRAATPARCGQRSTCRPPPGSTWPRSSQRSARCPSSAG